MPTVFHDTLGLAQSRVPLYAKLHVDIIVQDWPTETFTKLARKAWPPTLTNLTGEPLQYNMYLILPGVSRPPWMGTG